MAKTIVQVGTKKLALGNLDKVLYPAAGFVKAQVLDYYRRIAPVILPHLKGRPVTMKRYPDGVAAGYFYEKRCPVHRPDWMHTKRVPAEGPPLDYCVIDDEAALIWVANLASIELHSFLYTVKDIDRPTTVAFDMDPGPPATLLDCLPLALEMRDRLADRGLKAFPKTSGGKGLHLFVPLNTPITFAQTKAFAQALARDMEADHPDRVLSKPRKDLRRGKVFIDWSQNDEHKTTVCAYSLRARERPTVSTPVAWKELEAAQKKRSAAGLAFEAGDVLERVRKKGDLFAPVLTLRQTLPRPPAGKKA
jgi:bifunctional non-homologous end joining protein LigD